MHRYSFFKALFLSFFSKDFYCDVLQNRKGLGFSYLFFINLIVSLVIIIFFTVKVNSFDSKNFSNDVVNKMFADAELTFEENLSRILDVISQIPRITFENGELSTNKQEPYAINDPVTGNGIVIFDTTGYYNGLENTDAVMLFTKTKVITKKNKHTEQAHYISEMTQDKSNEEDLNIIFAILSQIPKITIKNGMASIEEHVPYNIVDDKGLPLIIIDTDGDYEPIDDKRAFMLITEDKIFIKSTFIEGSKDTTVKEILISDINEDMVYALILEVSKAIRGFLMWFLPLIVLPLYIIFTFVFSLIFILLISLITLLFGKIVKLKNFEYENALRLSSFAITPVFFMSKLSPSSYANQGLIYFLILLGYLYFAVYANRGNNRAES